MIEEKQQIYAEHIMLGSLTIGANMQTIKTLFSCREQCEEYYSYNGQHEILLEISFSSSSLMCSFDDNRICESAILLFDDEMDFAHCLEFCCDTFSKHEMLNGWKVNNCVIKKYMNGQEYGLLFFPLS